MKVPLQSALRVVWVSDDRADAQTTAAIARGALRGGVRACILREPRLADPAFAALCAAVRPEFDRVGGWLFAHERSAPLQQALLARGLVDGLHRKALALAKPEPGPGVPNWIRGFSTHSAAELDLAAIAGADYVLLGSVFPTATHPGAATLGFAAAARLAVTVGMPVVAIGGIDADTAPRFATGPFAGVACMRAIAAAADPERAAAAIVAALVEGVAS